MTLKEVCEKYDVAESSMTNAWPRTQKAILKKYGVKLEKKGRGQNAVYTETIENDNRALTMYDEIKDEMIIDNESFKLMNWDFLVFLAIVTTPMLVFRGSFEDFLRYIEVKPTKENIVALKGALSSLEERDFISYNLDKTNVNYFVAALYRKTEEEMHIGMTMIQRCKALADKYNKRSWVPLLKVWLGVQVCVENQPFTIDTLEEITGLSRYQVIESKKLLEKDDFFKTSRAYIAVNYCVGSKVELNGIYN